MARYSLPLLVALIATSFYGCRKIDLNFNDPAKHCQIQVMTGELNPFQIHRQFHYNEFGNPTLVEYVETEGGTGTPNFYFHYNDKQQLIQYTGWGAHNFTYNTLGQVVIDSSREYYTGGDARFATNFFYDLYGRISKTVTKYYYDINPIEGVGETTTVHYKYDRRGNLVLPGVTYDNKTSIYRTHPLWMFLNRNYSINNPAVATSYNAAGLPLTFGAPGIDFLQSSIFVESVEYICEQAEK